MLYLVIRTKYVLKDNMYNLFTCPGPGSTLMEPGVMSGLLPASAANTLLTSAGGQLVTSAGGQLVQAAGGQLVQAAAAGGQGQRISIEEAEAVQSMEVSHDTTILFPFIISLSHVMVYLVTIKLILHLM